MGWCCCDAAGRSRQSEPSPVEDPADEGRDERDARLGARDGLREGEEEGQVAVDAVLLLQDLRRKEEGVVAPAASRPVVSVGTADFVRLVLLQDQPHKSEGH